MANVTKAKWLVGGPGELMNLFDQPPTKPALTLECMLERIIEYQQALFEQCGGLGYKEPAFHKRMGLARNAALGLFMEVAEMTDSMPWKPWRTIDDQPYDRENLKREIIDCIFFLASVSAFNYVSSSELEEHFEKVMANNYARLTNGYNKKLNT
jgi:dimeric dUTPase (all-alpha-NTP-PPase superfamily)